MLMTFLQKNFLCKSPNIVKPGNEDHPNQLGDPFFLLFLGQVFTPNWYYYIRQVFANKKVVLWIWYSSHDQEYNTWKCYLEKQDKDNYIHSISWILGLSIYHNYCFFRNLQIKIMKQKFQGHSCKFHDFLGLFRTNMNIRNDEIITCHSDLLVWRTTFSYTPMV